MTHRQTNGGGWGHLIPGKETTRELTVESSFGVIGMFFKNDGRLGTLG